jgi:hypothetical protein
MRSTVRAGVRSAVTAMRKAICRWDDVSSSAFSDLEQACNLCLRGHYLLHMPSTCVAVAVRARKPALDKLRRQSWEAVEHVQAKIVTLKALVDHMSDLLPSAHQGRSTDAWSKPENAVFGCFSISQITQMLSKITAMYKEQFEVCPA